MAAPTGALSCQRDEGKAIPRTVIGREGEETALILDGKQLGKTLARQVYVAVLEQRENL